MMKSMIYAHIRCRKFHVRNLFSQGLLSKSILQSLQYIFQSKVNRFMSNVYRQLVGRECKSNRVMTSLFISIQISDVQLNQIFPSILSMNK
jgi:hypothetical protein